MAVSCDMRQSRCHHAQDLITNIVTVSVVYSFEVIDIQQDNREVFYFALCTPEFIVQQIVHGAAIADARKHVVHGKLVEVRLQSLTDHQDKACRP